MDDIHAGQDERSPDGLRADLVGQDHSRRVAQPAQRRAGGLQRIEPVFGAVLLRRQEADRCLAAEGPDGEHESQGFRHRRRHLALGAPVQQQRHAFAQLVQRDGGRPIGERREDRRRRRIDQGIADEAGAVGEGLSLLLRQGLDGVFRGELLLAVITIALMRAVADVVEVDAVYVVSQQTLDHQVALEAAHLRLAEVVPVSPAGPVFDAPFGPNAEDVPGSLVP